MVRPGHVLYDMCCDHGLIGFAALDKVEKVYFVDQSVKALKAVYEHLETLSPRRRAKTEVLPLAGELIDISAEKSADFIIAGVGVTTIASIIAALFPEGLGEHRLILAPQQDSQPLRWYLQERGFGLVDEYVIKEKIRFREIIVLESKGPKIGEMFRSDHDEVSREYKAWLKEYREKLAQDRLTSKF